MLRGLTTVNFFADDLSAARDWYTELLGVEPYFVREIEGAARLHRVPARRLPARARLHRQPVRSLGAQTAGRHDDLLGRRRRAGGVRPAARRWARPSHQEIREQGPGFVTASVVDPFGNVLGVMYNQHYLDVLGQSGE